MEEIQIIAKYKKALDKARVTMKRSNTTTENRTPVPLPQQFAQTHHNS